MANVADRLTGEARTFVEVARRATLATIAGDGRPRLVPVCFVLARDLAYIPIDEKPKDSADPLDLARMRDILRRPRITLLVDRWDEDWSRLGWVRLEGRPGSSIRPRPITPPRSWRSERSTRSTPPRPRRTAAHPDRRRARGLVGPARRLAHRLEELEQGRGEPLRALEARHVGDVREVDAAGAADDRRRRCRRHPPSSTECRDRRSSPASARGSPRAARWPAGRGRSCPRTASPGRRSRRPSGGRPRAPRQVRDPPAVRSRPPRSRRRWSASASQSFAPRGLRSLARGGLDSGVSSVSCPLMPAAHPDEAATRSGNSSAVSMTIEPAREQPTSTARSRPAASMTAISLAVREPGVRRRRRGRTRGGRSGRPGGRRRAPPTADPTGACPRSPRGRGRRPGPRRPPRTAARPPATSAHPATVLMAAPPAPRYTAVPIGRRQCVDDIAWMYPPAFRIATTSPSSTSGNG